MHGTICLYLQKFVQANASTEGWSAILDHVGQSARSFSPVYEYSDEDFSRIVEAAGNLPTFVRVDFLEEFGKFLAPELVHLYSNIIHPEWKTLEIVANTEMLIHAALSMRNPEAEPPKLDCIRISEHELQILYSSPRQLCGMARGILIGLADHFEESIQVSDQSCMHWGDPYCALIVSRVSTGDKRDGLGDGDIGIEETKVILPGCSQEDTKFTGRHSHVAEPTRFPFLDPPEQKDELGTLAHYRVLEILGEGTMGYVFRAEDSRLGRTLALKVLRPILAAESNSRKRFIREARALAALNSDHIVTVFDVGDEDGFPYLTMEYLDGESLESYRKNHGPLLTAEIYRLAIDITSGLVDAHAKGFIHRDIKPSNLWIESPSGRCKILDFGLAGVSANLDKITHVGSLIGTPAFMSPEQAKAKVVDHRADLFSLGCVLYWAMTNETPFKGEDVLSVLTALATEDPVPPIELAPGTPREFSDLIMQLLQKDPDDRPGSSRVVAEALSEQRWLALAVD